MGPRSHRFFIPQRSPPSSPSMPSWLDQWHQWTQCSPDARWKMHWDITIWRLSEYKTYVIWCYMMLYDVIWCYMMLYDVIWCYMMLYDVIWCYMMLYDVIWCYMLHYYTFWRSIKVLYHQYQTISTIYIYIYSIFLILPVYEGELARLMGCLEVGSLLPKQDGFPKLARRALNTPSTIHTSQFHFPVPNILIANKKNLRHIPNPPHHTISHLDGPWS